jgi:ubiquinone/menaquinone biosynthesis C-methylase UbiE
MIRLGQKKLEYRAGWPGAVYRSLTRNLRSLDGSKQELDLYSDSVFAEVLETWANDTAWPEIELLLRDRRGKVLDLACGTGRAFDFLHGSEQLEYYGCDISEMLIERAIVRGVPRERLRVGNAARLQYSDGEFDYLFSIGSLEHFSSDILTNTISECRRVCKGLCFHQMPVSRSGLDEGWFAPYQAYWNNSEAWWVKQFRKAFGDSVWTMKSKWADRWSQGMWFICASQ